MYGLRQAARSLWRDRGFALLAASTLGVGVGTSVALDAYQRYLAARPDAPDRVEVLARVEILRALRGRRGPPDRPDFIPASTILHAIDQAPPGLGRRLDRP